MHAALVILAGLLALSVIAAILICCLFTASSEPRRRPAREI
jgi:hypothetical protein